MLLLVPCSKFVPGIKITTSYTMNSTPTTQKAPQKAPKEPSGQGSVLVAGLFDLSWRRRQENVIYCTSHLGGISLRIRGSRWSDSLLDSCCKFCVTLGLLEQNLSRPLPRNRQPHALMRMPQWVSHNAAIDGAESHGKTLVSTSGDQVNIFMGHRNSTSPLAHASARTWSG